MELRQLKTFVTTVNNLSFTKTANDLGYAQSTITTQIQALEEELGTMLFDRVGKTIKLTKDGECLYTYANQILKLSEEAKETISNSLIPRGTLVVGTPESLCAHRLSNILKTFRSQYPDVAIDIRFDACSDYRTLLRKNITDIMFLLDVPLYDNNFVNHIFFEEPMSLIVAPRHPLSSKRHITPYDLNNQPLVLTDLGCSYRRIFESILINAGVKPSSTLGISSTEVVKKLVCDGWGIGFLPYMTVSQELLNEELISLPWAGPPFNINVQFVYHKKKWLSPALQAFIDITLENLKIPTNSISDQTQLLATVNN